MNRFDPPRPPFDGTQACLNADPELFFPEGHGRPPAKQIDAAKAVCASCPLQEKCLQWALRVNEWGIWGGTTGDERDRMRDSAGIVPITLTAYPAGPAEVARMVAKGRSDAMIATFTGYRVSFVHKSRVALSKAATP